ncbi:MAG: ABC transporter ATP-binding protein [Phycisphaerales bacterium JB037]
MPDAIVLENVRKTFGPKVAVDDMTLRVEEGGLYGFIGPNGAGKTTSIRMIMSIIFPDSGRLSVLGKASAVESKDRIGYLPEERGVYRKMKVGAFLNYIARLKGADAGPKLTSRIRDWLERVDLGPETKKRCEELSKGMQQKVQFIACVIHEPDLLILDEPFSGLDPVNMRLMRDLFLEQHQQGRTMIFSTHVMHQAEQLCDHIVMINRGRKVLDDTLDDIRARYAPRALQVDLFDPAHEADLAAVPCVRDVEGVEGEFIAHLTDDAAPTDALRQVAAAVPVRGIELRTPTLEDVFIDKVQKEHAGMTEEEIRASIRHGVAEPVAAGEGGAA